MTMTTKEWTAKEAQLRQEYADLGMTPDTIDSILTSVKANIGVEEPKAPAAPKPATTSEQPNPSTRERAVRSLAANLIAQGQDPTTAEANARRSLAYGAGEAFVATQADIDAMSAAEFRVYVAAGGQLPDPEPGNLPQGSDEVPQDLLDALGITDADLNRTGGPDLNIVAANVAARELRKAAEQAREAQVASLVASGQFTVEEAQKAAVSVETLEGVIRTQQEVRASSAGRYVERKALDDAWAASQAPEEA